MEKTSTERTQQEKTSVKFEAATTAGGKKGSRPCAGDIGSQLNAVKPDGRPYACGYGGGCTFQHIKIEGKTVKKLRELAEGMPFAAQRDILKAIKSRKAHRHHGNQGPSSRQPGKEVEKAHRGDELPVLRQPGMGTKITVCESGRYCRSAASRISTHLMRIINELRRFRCSVMFE